MESTLQSVLELDDPLLKLFLTGYKSHNILEGAASKDIVAVNNVLQAISSYLTKANTRKAGLRLFVEFSSQMQIEHLEGKFSLWMNLMLKASNAKEIAHYGHLIFTALEQLVRISKRSLELEKMVVSNYSTKVLEAAIQDCQTAELARLACLETCLRLYPAQSMHSRGPVLKFLNKFLDETDHSVIIAASKCYLALQQVKIGGNQQNVNTKDMWKIYQLNLIASLNNLLTEAFAKCSESVKRTSDREKAKTDFERNFELSSEPSERLGQIVLRFKNLVDFLIIALREPYPVPKLIQPKKLLDLIIRGVAVTFATIRRNAISDNFLLAILLPEIHFKLLQLLEALIATLDMQLRPYNKLIVSILIDELIFTSPSDNSCSSKFSDLRVKAYALISLWCRKYSFSSRLEAYMEHVVNEINKDITPYKTDMGLQIMNVSKKGMTKKARRNQPKETAEKANIGNTSLSDGGIGKRNALGDTNKRRVCCAALVCLKDALISTSLFLNPAMLKKIYAKILEVSSVLYEIPLMESNLYNDSNCRMVIYHLLGAVVKNPSALCPPPTDLAFYVLKSASTHDSNASIREFCKELLLDIEKLLHPQKETLLFTTADQDLSTEAVNRYLWSEPSSSQAMESTNNLNNGRHVEPEPENVEACENSNSISIENDEMGAPNDNIDVNALNHLKNSNSKADEVEVPSEQEYACLEPELEMEEENGNMISELQSESLESPIGKEDKSQLSAPQGPKRQRLERQDTPEQKDHRKESLNLNDDQDKILLAELESCFVDELG